MSRWKSSSPFFRELDRRCAGPSRLRHEPGALLVVVGGLGIPSIVRVEPDGSWMCVAGTFKGRPIRSDKNWCPWRSIHDEFAGAQECGGNRG